MGCSNWWECISFRLWGWAKASNTAFFSILSSLFNLPFAKLCFVVNVHTAKTLVLKRDVLVRRAPTRVPNVIINCERNTASQVQQQLLIMKNVQQLRKVSFNFSMQNLFLLCILISLFACLFCLLWTIFLSMLSLSINSLWITSSPKTPQDKFLHAEGWLSGLMK